VIGSVCRDLSIAKAAGKPSCSSFTGSEQGLSSSL